MGLSSPKMSGKDALTKQLGGKAPPRPIVQTVSDEDLGHLAETILDARRRQGEALAEAAEHSLRLIPRLLRRPVKKVLKL
jgi:hypothetical protein